MTTAPGLEGSYRRLLRWYPSSYRHRHEEEILGVLMAAAQPGQRRPGAGESVDLLWSALKIRIRMTLHGADSQPDQAAFALVGVLLPLLMLLLRLIEFLVRGAQYGFGTPADILIGAYGEPGSYARSFQLNPHSVALTGNVTDALTAGPLPALILAVLVCLGWRRAAAIFAAFVPLAFLGITLTSGYTLLASPRLDVTLYAYGLEALILFAAPGTARGWRVLRWQPSALLAAATVAAGVAMNGGLWPLFHGPLAVPTGARKSAPSAAVLKTGPGCWGRASSKRRASACTWRRRAPSGRSTTRRRRAGCCHCRRRLRAGRCPLRRPGQPPATAAGGCPGSCRRPWGRADGCAGQQHRGRALGKPREQYVSSVWVSAPAPSCLT